MLLNINYSPRTEQTECSGSQSCENMFRSEWSSPGSSSVYQCTRSCQRCPGPWSECPPDHDTLLPGSAERTRLIQLCCWSLQSTELGSRDDSCLSYFPDQTFLPCSSLSTLNIQTVGSDWIIECNHCHCSVIIPSQWLMFVTLWSDKLPSSNKNLSTTNYDCLSPATCELYNPITQLTSELCNLVDLCQEHHGLAQSDLVFPGTEEQVSVGHHQTCPSIHRLQQHYHSYVVPVVVQLHCSTIIFPTKLCL